jgi:hypothetical protein
MRRVSQLVALSLLLSALPALAQEEGEAEAEGGRRHSVFRSPGGLLDRSEHTRPMEIAFFLNLQYGYAGWYGYGFPFGVGGRLYLPLVADGFISSINDEFGLEGGLDFAMRFGSNGVFYPLLDIPVAAVWRFHLTDRWTVYPKVGLGISFGYLYSSAAPVNFIVESLVGAIFKINDLLSLRFEVGYPSAKVGLAIAL